MMNLKRYQEAEDKLSEAIKRAPEGVQMGLSEQRRRCIAEESGTTPVVHEQTPDMFISEAERKSALAQSRLKQLQERMANDAAMKRPQAVEDDLGNLDLTSVQQRAETGDAAAQAELGYRYMNGRGVPRNYSEAKAWIDKSANQGNALGEAELAQFYSMGYGGVVASEVQAYNWTRRAAEQGRAISEWGLSISLRSGEGVCQDLAESAAWARKAADQGIASAMQDLASDYEFGLGVPQDLAEARRWYEKAAAMRDNGYAAFAKRALETLNALTAGVLGEQVDVPAVGGCALNEKTLGQKAYAGDDDAKAQLATIEQQGGDLPTRKRAALGDPNAQESLGEAFLYQKKYEQAEFWLKHASRKGDGRADYDLAQIAVLQYRPDQAIPRDELAAMLGLSGSPGSSQDDFRTMPAAKILRMLQNANTIRLNIKGTNFPSLDREDVEWGKACNGEKSKAASPSENACFLVFTNYGKTALNDLTNEANLNYLISALLRGCGLYAPSGNTAFSGRTCGVLGRTLYVIGNEEAARTMWELAPGCYSWDERAGTPVNGCIKALNGKDEKYFTGTNGPNLWRDLTSVYRGEPHRLAEMMWRSCTSIHDRESCDFLQRMGASVDMGAVEQMENARHEGIEEFRAKNQAEYDREQAAAEARRNAIFETLSGMGGSNPTAVLDTANGQANALRAIRNERVATTAQTSTTAANNGSSQQQNTTGGSGATNIGLDGTAQNAVTNGQTLSPASGNSTQTNANAGGTGGNQVSTTAAQYVAPADSKCINSFYDPSVYGWLSLQNTCSQALTIAFTGTETNSTTWGSMDLNPGQKRNTGYSPSEIGAAGGLRFYPCPYGYIPTDSTGHGITANPVAQYACKYRGY